MNVYEFRQAVADQIKILLPSLKTCEPHAGRVTLAEIKRVTKKLPGVLVSTLRISSSERLETDESLVRLQMAAFVITRDKASISKDEAALNITGALAEYAPGTTWGLVGEGVRPAQRVKGDNLYSGMVDKHGIALWAVTWEQEIIVGQDIFAPDEDAILPSELYTTSEEDRYGVAIEYDQLAPQE